jgi:hypothetical protein
MNARAGMQRSAWGGAEDGLTKITIKYFFEGTVQYVCSSRTRTTLYRCTRTCAVTRCTEVNKIILSYNNSMRRRSCGGTRIYTRVQYSSIFCTSGNRYESTFVLPYFVLIYTYVTHTFVRVQLQDTCTRRGTNYVHVISYGSTTYIFPDLQGIFIYSRTFFPIQ